MNLILFNFATINKTVVSRVKTMQSLKSLHPRHRHEFEKHIFIHVKQVITRYVKNCVLLDKMCLTVSAAGSSN